MLSQDRDRPPIPAPPDPDPDPGPTRGPDVALVHWPDDDATRRRLQAAHRPRLLLVAAGAPPPVAVDELEDWVRLPVDPEELDIRRATLARRAVVPPPANGGPRAEGPTAAVTATRPGPAALLPLRPARPEIDDHGVLRYDDRWVALGQVELRTVDRLLGSWGQVVRRPDLTRATWPDGPPADQRAIDGVVKRLRRRLTPLGLRIHTVTGKGFLLDIDPDVDVDVDVANGAG